MRIITDTIISGFREEMESLFDISIPKINVCILSVEEFKHFKDADWLVGFAFPRKRSVFVIEEADSGRSHDEWLKIIKHEIVHIFYELKFQTGNPRWFNEGLANYLSGQNKKIVDVDIKTLLKYHSTADEEIYSVGYSAIKKLLEK